MLVNILKFIHVLAAISLLSLAIYCLCSRNSKRTSFIRINKKILWLSLIALLTGSLLVYPKHFTFHTPWIKAAYLLLIIFISGVVFLSLSKRKSMVVYTILIVLLTLIIHDAVTKSTFLF